MKKKGEILFWDLEKFKTTKAELGDLGFDKYLPRNNHRQVLTKALKEYKSKSDEKVIARTFNEDSNTLSVAIFNELVTEEDLSLEKEITVQFDKRIGTMTTTNPSHPTFKELVELYRENSGNINADQLRTLLLKVVKEEAYGVSFRRHGGAYFVDDSNLQKLENVERLFKHFPANATLYRIPIFDTAGTLDAIESSVKLDISEDIEKLIAEIDDEFKKGTITEKKLENRKEMAESILDKMKSHETNLRDSYLTVHRKLASVRKALDEVTSKVSAELAESSSFMDLLKEL